MYPGHPYIRHCFGVDLEDRSLRAVCRIPSRAKILRREPRGFLNHIETNYKQCLDPSNNAQKLCVYYMDILQFSQSDHVFIDPQRMCEGYSSRSVHLFVSSPGPTPCKKRKGSGTHRAFSGAYF